MQEIGPTGSNAARIGRLYACRYGGNLSPLGGKQKLNEQEIVNGTDADSTEDKKLR